MRNCLDLLDGFVANENRILECGPPVHYSMSCSDNSFDHATIALLHELKNVVYLGVVHIFFARVSWFSLNILKCKTASSVPERSAKKVPTRSTPLISATLSEEVPPFSISIYGGPVMVLKNGCG
jgi:hypothetical protein